MLPKAVIQGSDLPEKRRAKTPWKGTSPVETTASYPSACARTMQGIFSSWRKTKRGARQRPSVRGETDAEDERRAYAEQSTLTALVSHLGQDAAAWLESALSPLPETFRISLHRSDRAWTVDQIRALGAQSIPWMPDETAFTMPFARGKAPEGLAAAHDGLAS